MIEVICVAATAVITLPAGFYIGLRFCSNHWVTINQELTRRHENV